MTYGARAAGRARARHEITAQARIVFDFNAPIDTPEWSNRIDAEVPQSAVTSVDAGVRAELQRRAAGHAGRAPTSGAGVDVFDVWVSEDGGGFTPWITDSTATQRTFAGAPGTSYAFYSVARDRAGLTEGPPSGRRRVGARSPATAPRRRRSPPSRAATPSGGVYPGPVTVRLDGIDQPGGTGVDRITWTATGASPGSATVDGDTAAVPVGAGTTTVTARSRDAAGNESDPASITVKVAGDTPAPEPTPSPGPTATPAPTATPPAAVPRLSARPVTIKLGKVNRKGVARLTVRNREAFPIAIRGRVVAAKKLRSLTGSRRGTLAAGQARALKLKFRKRVQRGRRLRARVDVVVTGPAGDTRTVRGKVTVRGWSPKRK